MERRGKPPGLTNSGWNTSTPASEMLAEIKSQQAQVVKEKSEIEKETPFTFVMADLPEPRESFVMVRGAYDKPGEKVTRAVPDFCRHCRSDQTSVTTTGLILPIGLSAATIR